jgi:3-deoxy-D-manno-octulosonic-acid transferase
VAGEEEIVLAAFQRIRKSLPDAALVIAPRRPERFGEIPALVEAAGLRCVRRTAWDAEAWNAGAVLLLDTIGELAQVYPMATVVFVGGSLMPAGGHNILEAAVAGKAVVVGPHMENFQEIADEFRSAGALVQIASADELAAATFSILTDAARRRSVGERARSLIDGNKGAVQGTVDALAGLIA